MVSIIQWEYGRDVVSLLGKVRGWLMGGPMGVTDGVALWERFDAVDRK